MEEAEIIDAETLCEQNPEQCDLYMEEKMKSGVSPETDMVMPEIDPELQPLIDILNDPRLLAAFIALSIWALIWKGFALWRAARQNQMIWFIALLGVNSLGLLEISYLFVFSKIKII